jgi:hypothetical protein
MMDLFKAEWYKLQTRPVFWIVLLLQVVFIAGMILLTIALPSELLQSIYEETALEMETAERAASEETLSMLYGQILSSAIFLSLFYIDFFLELLIIVMVALYVGSEFQWRTFQQTMVRGYSAGSIILVKMGIILLWIIFSIMLAAGLGVVLGGIMNYFFEPAIASETFTTFELYEILRYALFSFFGVLLYGVFTLFVTILSRSSTIGIVFPLVYTIALEGPLEWIVNSFLGDRSYELLEYFFMENAKDNLTGVYAIGRFLSPFLFENQTEIQYSLITLGCYFVLFILLTTVVMHFKKNYA